MTALIIDILLWGSLVGVSIVAWRQDKTVLTSALRNGGMDFINIVPRIALGVIGSGFIADRFGGVVTLLIGSVMQAVALLLYALFDGLVSLYVISILFGLFQGGIVPSYAVIIRQYFPPQEAGVRVGTVIMVSVVGMALGGWMSGYIFDLTGSYRAAFLNGLAWNLLNGAIAAFLLMRARRFHAVPA